jgi:S1-C subfamily serine protease
MKEKFSGKVKGVLRIFMVLLLVVPLMFVFTACDSTSTTAEILSIEKTGSSGLEDTYTITYSNGKQFSFTVTNGQNGTNGTNGTDGESLDIEEIYKTAKQNGYTGTFLDFLDAYLDLDYDADAETKAINNALLSAVSVYANYTVTETNYFGGGSQDVDYTSAGSGVIYSLNKTDGDAYIITNYHVIYAQESNDSDHISDDISVYLYGYEDSDYTIPATFYGGSMTYDIAVLKVEDSDVLKESDAKQVTVADSNDISVGETAVAIGNPEMLGLSATSGIVSVDSEYITMESIDESGTSTHRVIRIDTAVNSGNSGGGLFNADGELIGIVNAKNSSDEVDNIGYAIPSNIAVNVAQNIIDNGGECEKVVLGITLDSSNSKSVYNEDTGLTSLEEDVFIDTITADSLAETLGFETDDQIVSVIISGTELDVTRIFQVVDFMCTARVGDSVTFTILRDNVSQTINFVVSQTDLQLYA